MIVFDRLVGASVDHWDHRCESHATNSIRGERRAVMEASLAGQVLRISGMDGRGNNKQLWGQTTQKE